MNLMVAGCNFRETPIEIREKFAFDAKKVELARIARRTAELEIQRTTEMITRRAEQSSMTRPPPPPPAPAKK